MKKKHIIAILLTLILCFLLSACGGSSSDEKDNTSGDNTSSSENTNYEAENGLISSELLTSDEWCAINDEGVASTKWQFTIDDTPENNIGTGNLYFKDEISDSFEWEFDGKILSFSFGDGSKGNWQVEKTEAGYYRVLSFPYTTGNVYVRRADIEKAIETEKKFVHDKREEFSGVVPDTSYSPEIGMTVKEVLLSAWGEPDKKNITETSSGTHEQWVYSNNRYVYFDDGIVTGIQKSE